MNTTPARKASHRSCPPKVRTFARTEFGVGGYRRLGRAGSPEHEEERA